MTTHDTQFSQSVRLGTGGRLVIPAELRKQMGWKPDEALRIRLVDGEVRIESLMDGIRRAQSIIAKNAKRQGSVVDSLLADRRAEAAKDQQETQEWRAASGTTPRT